MKLKTDKQLVTSESEDKGSLNISSIKCLENETDNILRIMNVRIEEQDGNMVAILEGSLDTAAAAETEKAMSPLNDVADKDIIIDCTDLSYISSAGLRIFLGILQSAQAKGRHVYIQNINDTVRGVFTITGFSNIFEFK